MFELQWRDHSSHEWILEARMPNLRAVLRYLAFDSPVLRGQYKLSYEGIEVMRIDQTVLEGETTKEQEDGIS